MSTNPFRYRLSDGTEVETMAADDRVRRVRSFTYDQCVAALAVPGLQKAVERAVHVRMRAQGVPCLPGGKP